MKRITRLCKYKIIAPALKKFEHPLAIPPEEAREELESFSPDPGKGRDYIALADNRLDRPFLYDLQIVVPCYNVENYVVECLDSILQQHTKYRFRVILVDDGSTDRTLELLKQYCDHPQIEIIHQQNGGLSAARNVGIQTIRGKYLMFVDSDDYLMPGAVEALLDCAFENDADIVQGGFFRKNGTAISILLQYEDGPLAVHSIPGYAWGKVYRAELFAKVQYPAGFWFEDTMNHFLLHRRGMKTYSMSKMVYMYRWSEISITASAQKSRRTVESYWITEGLLKDIRLLNIEMDSDLLDKLLRQFLMNGRRASTLPDRIQRCVFILECALLAEINMPEIKCSNELVPVYEAFRKKHYYQYLDSAFNRRNV